MQFTRRILALAAAALTLALSSTVPAHADPALWLVKGPHSTVYLFGTVHVLPKDKPWRTPRLDTAIASSNDLWLEVPNADDAAAAQPLILQLGIDAAHPLSTLLTPDQLTRLKAIATSAGLPNGEAGMEPMRPWLAAVSLSLFPLLKSGYDPKSGVEALLKPEFTNANKPVHGFETLPQQLHFFADMPQKSELAYLDSSIKDFDHSTDQLNQTIAAWYAGDLDALDKIFDGQWRAEHPELYKLLVIDRNKVFASQIDALLKGNNQSFVAIGAGHLVGPDGVPALLQKLGYTVERVQ